MKVVLAFPAIFFCCVLLTFALFLAHVLDEAAAVREALALCSQESLAKSLSASLPPESNAPSFNTSITQEHEKVQASLKNRQLSRVDISDLNEQAHRKVAELEQWNSRRVHFKKFLTEECPADVIPRWTEPDGHWMEFQSPTRFEDKETWVGEGLNVSEFFRIAPSAMNTRLLVVGDSHMDGIYQEIRLQLTSMGLNFSDHLRLSWNYKLGRNAAKMLYLDNFHPTHILLGRGTWDGPVNNKNTIIHTLKEGLVELGRAFHGSPIVFAGVRHIAKLPRVVKESRKLGAKCFNQNHLRNRWTKCECFLDNTPLLRLAYYHAVKLANIELLDLGFERSALIRFANCENITKLLTRPLGKYSRDGSHLGIISPPQLAQTHFLLQRLLTSIPEEAISDFDSVPNCTTRVFRFFRDAHVCPWTKLEDSPQWQLQRAEELAKKMDTGHSFCGNVLEFVSKTFGDPADYLATMQEDALPSSPLSSFLRHLSQCLKLAKQIGRPQLQEISDKWDSTDCEDVTSFFRFVPHQKVEAVIRRCNSSEKILANYREAQWEALGITHPK
jgi:hypothetical protein